MSSVKTITDSEFKSKVENSDKTVLISFWANWSAPSRMIEPSLNAAATEYDGKAEIYKMDTDSNQTTAMYFQINGLPTLLVFKKGKLYNSHVGAASKATISQMLAGSI